MWNQPEESLNPNHIDKENPRDMINYKLYQAVSHDNLDLVHCYLDRNNSNLIIDDMYKQPLLHFATSVPVAELLIQFGARVTATNFLGETALGLALNKGNKDLIQTLRSAASPSSSPPIIAPEFSLYSDVEPIDNYRRIKRKRSIPLECSLVAQGTEQLEPSISSKNKL